MADEPYRSTICPECDRYAISGSQEADEHETETCECPNGHTWERVVWTGGDQA